MQAAPLVACDVFAISTLSIGVRSSAGVPRGFRSEGVGEEGTTRSTPNTPSVS